MKPSISFFLLYLILVSSAFAAERSSFGASLDAPPATLVIWNREIVVFRATLGRLTPEERLQKAKKRLTAITDFQLYKAVIQKPVEVNEYRGIGFLLDEIYLFAIFEPDLDPETGETLEQAADQIIARLNAVRQAQRDQSRPALSCLISRTRHLGPNRWDTA